MNARADVGGTTRHLLRGGVSSRRISLKGQLARVYIWSAQKQRGERERERKKKQTNAAPSVFFVRSSVDVSPASVLGVKMHVATEFLGGRRSAAPSYCFCSVYFFNIKKFKIFVKPSQARNDLQMGSHLVFVLDMSRGILASAKALCC